MERGELLLHVDAVPRRVGLTEEGVTPSPLQPLVLDDGLALDDVEGEVAREEREAAA